VNFLHEDEGVELLDGNRAARQPGDALGEVGRDAALLDPAIDVLVAALQEVGQMDDGLATLVIRRTGFEQQVVQRAEVFVTGSFHGVQ